MGEVIENRVVQMAFDNTKFEKGIQSTLNLLGRLNNAITGLNTIKYNILGVADQVKAVTFDPINTQLQIGIGKAVALTAALTGVYNVTDQIYNTMVRTVRAMTFDNIDAGYARYEQVVNSTQVLLASAKKEGETTEQTMERVEEIQEKLLWFADETSYDAMAMLDTISKFTSHGFGLEEAATAMEGIANWAATAGVNATSATHAMEQLAQTIGKGYVGSQDWISIQGLNMDTTKFKELVIDAAVARGELKKVGNEVRTLDGTMDVTAYNMEKSFSKKWFTKDVLNDVLRKYGEANEIIRRVQEEQGFDLASEAIDYVKNNAEYAEYMLSIEAFEMGQVARTWTDAYQSVQTAVATKISSIFKTIFGDYLEAKDLWTEVSEKLYEIFVEPLNTVLDAFKKWSDKDGFKGAERFWNAMKTIYKAIETTMSQLWEIVSKVFGKEAVEDGQKVYSIMESIFSLLESGTRKITFISNVFSRFMHNLRDNEKVWKNIESFLNGIKIGFDIVSDAVSKFTTKVIGPLSGRAGETIETFSGLGTTFERLMQDIQFLADKTDFFNKAFDTTYTILDKVVTLLNTFVEKFNHFTGTLYYLNTDKEGNGGFFTGLLASAEEAEGPIDKIFAIIDKGLDDITTAIDVFSPVGEQLFGMIMTIIGGIGQIAETLAPSVKSLFDAFAGFITENTKDFDFVTFMDTICTGILTFTDKIGKQTVDNIIYLLSSLRTELVAWKDAFIGQGDFVQILQDNMSLLLGIAVTIMGVKTWFEELLSFKWDGIFGKLMWGDTLTNLTDQLYYKALAQTFSAVADGILAIAAALFVISLIDPSRLEDSLDALKQISMIMFVLIGVVEILSANLENINLKFKPLGKGMEGLKKGVSEGLGGFVTEGMDMMAYSMKLEAVAKIISAITWGFIKIAAAMLILDQIKNPEQSLIILGTIAVVMIALLFVCAILAGDDSSFVRDQTSKVVGGSKLFGLPDSTVTRKFKLGKSLNGILQSAAALLLITAAIGRVAKSLKILSGIPEDDLLSATTSLTQMLVVITAFMFLVAGITKWIDSGQGDTSIIKVARVISVMSFGLLVITGALLLLTKLGDMDKMPEAAKWLGICFGAFSFIAVVLLALSKTIKTDDIAGITIISSLLVAMIAPLIVVSAALAVLSNMPIDGLEAAADNMVKVLMAVAAILLGMRMVNSDPKTLMAIAGSMALVMLSLLELAPLLLAMKELEGIDWKIIAAVFGGITVIMAAFIGLSTIASKNAEFSTVIIGVAGAIAILGASGLMAAAGIFLIATAFDIFVTAFSKLKDIDAEKIRDNLITLSESLPVIFEAIGKGIKLAFQAIFEGDDTDYISEMFIKIFNGLFDALFALMPRLMSAILVFVPQIILDTITILERVLPRLLDFLNDFGVLLTKEVISGTIRIIFAVTRGVQEGLVEAMPEIIETLNKVTDGILENGDEFIEAVKRLAGPLKHLIEELIDPLLDMLEPFRKVLYRMMEFVLDVVNDFGVILTEKVIAGTIRISLAVLTGFIEGLATGLPEFIDNVAKLVIQFMNALADVIDENGDELIEAIDHLMKSIGDFVWKVVVHWGEEGSAFFEGGVQIVAGITRGITSRLRKVQDAAFSLGEYVKNGFCKILRIESPSKVFEQLGQYIPEGLMIGIQEKSQAVYDMFGGFASKVKDSFTEHFGGLGGSLGDTLSGMLSNLNLNPEITPILNLTNVEEGLGNLTSMFNGENILGSLNMDDMKDLTKVFEKQQLSGMIGADGFNIGDISLGNDAVSLNNTIGDLNTKMDKLINIETINANKTNDVSVILEGDAKGLFKSVKTENSKRTRATGYNALMGAQA